MSITTGLGSITVTAPVTGRPSPSFRHFRSLAYITACWLVVRPCSAASSRTTPGKRRPRRPKTRIACPIASVKDYVAVYYVYFLALTATPECAGFPYVQLYDIEGEVKGYRTYDRKPRVPAHLVAEVHDEVLRARAAIHREGAG